MFKVLLISPPRYHLVHLDTTGNVDLGEISSFPPIGLMFLAEALRKGLQDIEIKIIDANVSQMSTYDLVEQVSNMKPDVIGLTSFTYTFYDLCLTASQIKKTCPDIPIIVGGPHMSIFAKETMSHKCFDFGFAGDGELGLIEFCKSIINKTSPENISGIVYRRNGKVQTNGLAFTKDIDEFVSIPAIDLIDPHKYYSTLGPTKAVGTICTSIGCPFQCTFCQVTQKKYRKRAVNNVLDEMEAYIKLGISDFFFFDDLFNINPKRVIEICNEIIKRDMNVGWMFRGRAEQVTDEMLYLAKRAGCHTFSMGIEAATNEGLKEIRKNLTIESAFEAVKMCKKHGIATSANWIIGFPHQKTEEDMDYLLNNAIKMNPDYAQFSVLQLMPGSELFDEASADESFDHEAWRRYVLNPTEKFSPPIWEKHFTQKELFAFYESMFRKYYFRPSVVLKELMRTRSLNELYLKFKSLKPLFYGLVNCVRGGQR